jgi:hypothetical protein
MTDDFHLASDHRPDLSRLADLPALREHVDRLQRSIRDRDTAQLLGSTKELLETVAKVVLGTTSSEPAKKFPALLTAPFDGDAASSEGVPICGIWKSRFEKFLAGRSR